MLDVTLGLTAFVYIYFCFKIIDFILGICKGFYQGNFDTKVMRKGIIAWVGELCCIFLLAFIDNTFALANILVNSSISLFVFKEYSSITRNLQALGIEIPNIVDITIRNLFSNNDGKDE